MESSNALHDRPPISQRVLAAAALAGGVGALYLCLPFALSWKGTLGAAFAAFLGIGWFVFFAIAARSLWNDRAMSVRLTIFLEVFGAVLFGSILLILPSSPRAHSAIPDDIKLWSIVVVLLLDAMRRGRGPSDRLKPR